MRCLVGVMAFALLAFGGIQASSAASLVLPTICTMNDDGSCSGGPDVDGGIGDGIGGLDQSFGSISGTPSSVREKITEYGGPDLNRPLTVTVDGGSFDVVTDTISVNSGETVSVVVKIRNFEREWQNEAPNNDFTTPDGPVPIVVSSSTLGYIGFLDYRDSSSGYTIPLNVTLGGGADRLVVDGVSATIVAQPSEIMVDSNIFAEGVNAGENEDFATQGAASFNVALQDGDMNELDSTGQDQFGAGGVSINSFVQDELLIGDGTAFALIIEDLDALAPSSFDLVLDLTSTQAIGEVPLPAAAWLFLSGIGALVGFRRFRGKA